MRTINTTIFAILAVGLLAGSAVGVAAQDELELLDGFGEKASTSFTGRFTSQLDVISEGTESVLDDLRRTDGVVVRMSMVSSDARLTGAVTFTGSWVVDGVRADGNATIMTTGRYELTNDGGSWVGQGNGFGDLEHEVNTAVVTFVGRGGYEGLTAVAVLDSWDWRQEYVGTIFPAAMPETPGPYVD